jgi:hypothetical protein
LEAFAIRLNRCIAVYTGGKVSPVRGRKRLASKRFEVHDIQGLVGLRNFGLSTFL